MANRVDRTVDKYRYFIPDNDYRVHIERHGEPWVVIAVGANAVAALLYEMDEMEAQPSHVHSWQPSAWESIQGEYGIEKALGFETRVTREHCVVGDCTAEREVTHG